VKNLCAFVVRRFVSNREELKMIATANLDVIKNKFNKEYNSISSKYVAVVPNLEQKSVY